MKQLFLAVLLYASLPVFSQGGTSVNAQRAIVTHWGSRAIILLSDNYFLETKDSIIAQIGQEEFDNMKNKCSKNGWPDGLYSSDLSEEEDRKFDSLLNNLKMYSIASYTHIYYGTRFDRYVILRVPYEENKEWNANVKWDWNVYFLLKEKDVQPL
ncbi:MAG: hypothetical protein ABIR30_12620 [Chitinophagaceae bacterium]